MTVPNLDVPGITCTTERASHAVKHTDTLTRRIGQPVQIELLGAKVFVGQVDDSGGVQCEHFPQSSAFGIVRIVDSFHSSKLVNPPTNVRNIRRIDQHTHKHDVLLVLG